jgi:hypothetical protein
MASITAIARTFFTTCETGKGWEVCVKQDASLAQSQVLARRRLESVLAYIPQAEQRVSQ